MSKLIQFPHEKVKEEISNKQVSNQFVKCENCGGVKFQQVFVLKIITPLDDPSLNENTVVPIPVFECTKCKKTITLYG